MVTTETDLRQAMADLAALPERRRWDIEPERKRLRAKVERLLDEYNRDGQPPTPDA